MSVSKKTATFEFLQVSVATLFRRSWKILLYFVHIKISTKIGQV